MKILFLMLQMPEEGEGAGMYVDLATTFVQNGHEVTVMVPDNAHARLYTREERGMRVLRVNSLPTQGVKNMIKKGINLATLPYFYKKAYNRFLKKECFDWVFMPTPPITLVDFVSFVKTRSGARFYLILRDIHPQSAASIGLIKYKFMYNYLAKRANYGYELADCIGCMSRGNIDYIASNYPSLDRSKLVVLYNWLSANPVINPIDNIREKFNLQDKFVALFGGNIGLGQRIENILFLAEHYKSNIDIVFVIVGKGVEKDRLMRLAHEKDLNNMQFVDFIPQNDYLSFVKSVDLGLISINENYTVPTCPSKAVAYMSLGVPILAMINPGSDYGQMIENVGAGFWSIGPDKEKSIACFERMYSDALLRKSMSEAGMNFYNRYLTSDVAYQTIMLQIKVLGNGN